ncbi:MAG: HIT family protein [Thermoplasmata archaeon]|nr:HIT family protein [Thermoplasmata archaeon]MCI4338040.1 HIT family protein [Thermoplasmata archaeon]MCI4341848.1 HIT family protein [Thermoplasmata archaeon]
MPKAPGECVFCDIANRRAPSHIVFEDEHALAFLDLFPFTRGHLLVVPKKHVDRLVDLPESEYGALLKALATACRRVERLTPHYNIASNQGELAGQIVFHLHFHVIPRYGGPNPFHDRPRGRLEDGEAQTLLDALHQ